MLRKAKGFIKDKASEAGEKYKEAMKNQKATQSKWKKKEEEFSKHQTANRKMFNSQQKQRSDHFKKKQREAHQSFQKDNDPIDRKKTAIVTLAAAAGGGALSSALKMKKHLNKLRAERLKVDADKLNVDKEKVISHAPGFIEKYGPHLGAVGITAGAIGAGVAANKYLKSRKK
jgi:hypothetical protein